MQTVLRTHAFRSALAATAALLAAWPSASIAGPMPKEAGVWYDDTGRGAVKIEPCGTKLCGRIVWLKSLVNDKGEPLIDRYNPDSNLRTRPVCGLQVVGQLEPVSEGGYDNGWIYDPKEGKSYSVAIVLAGPDELSVTGYKGVKFLSKTFTWKRAKTELPSCAAAPVETKAQPGAGSTAPAAAAAKVAPAVVAPAAAAPAKSNKANAGDALPWAGDKQQPAAKPAPAGASNLGAAKPQNIKPAAPKSTNAPGAAKAGAAPAPGAAAKAIATKAVAKTPAKPVVKSATSAAAKTAAPATAPSTAPAAKVLNAKPAPKKPEAPVEKMVSE